MSSPESTRVLRVLLVEDSLPVRERMRSLIEEFVGVVIVAEASCAMSAMAAFGVHTPDAVVLDLHLQDSTGYSVLEGVKRVRPECTVIVLTSFAIPECRARCMQLGADYFFEKSKEFERVPEALLAVLARHTSKHP